VVGESVGTNRTFGVVQGVLCLVASLVLVVGGIVASAVETPDTVNLVSLEWSRSTAGAVHMVGTRAAEFRTGLYWDLVLAGASTIGILLACYLGRRVFWTVGLLRWAWTGYLAALLAGLSTVVQDVLLLRVLHADPIHGSWIFRTVEALSLLRFSFLIAAGSVAVISLGTAMSLLATHSTTKCRWLDARAAAHGNGGDEVGPLVIPAPPIEVDRQGEPRVTWLDASIAGAGGTPVAATYLRCTSPRTVPHPTVPPVAPPSASRVEASGRRRSRSGRCSRCGRPAPAGWRASTT